ncbi:zinc finger BED domain-containing protein RICESLEEPER 3 [Artemisia annua]|uniref:Zinc finger BED domain-containing protein RICESLEEPER 3 n=1 Tax=Artemisia annua TaxID=35608 RepID=A0A2U1P2I0_ARTAN|nr:zinc finger BED domain-containing protein RICESLEEPER 3 [Artemisia annua]
MKLGLNQQPETKKFGVISNWLSSRHGGMKYGATNVGTSSISTMWALDSSVDPDLDWKQREPQFPVLAAMARDLLSVQASTVASESAFSTSGRVLSVRRTRLTPLSLEMCNCLKDYLYGNERIQDVSILEEPMEYEKQLQEIEVEEGYQINLSEEEVAFDEATSATRAAIEDEDETD